MYSRYSEGDHMAVSKVAVIALVAIVACPILLGFGLNFENNGTYLKYDAGQYTDVTKLLSSSNSYSFYNTNVYENNSNNFELDHPVYNTPWDNNFVYHPVYEITPVSTSIPTDQSDTVTDHEIVNLMDYKEYNLYSDYDASQPIANGQLKVRFQNLDDSWTGYYFRTVKVTWDYNNSKAYCIQVSPQGHYTGSTITCKALQFELDNYVGPTVIESVPVSGSTTYADLSKGYTLPENTIPGESGYELNWWVAPAPVRSAMFTIDISDVTDGLSFQIYTVNHVKKITSLTKTISAGVTTLTLDDGTQLYYDDSASSNTYQIIISKTGLEWRYVGDWPQIVGGANYYQTYTYEWSSQVDYDDFIDAVQIIKAAGSYPTMRVESSSAMSMTIPVVSDKEYDPSGFFTDSNTTSINAYSVGSSITFGGNTYNVSSDGDILLGTHRVSAYNLTFNTTKNTDGTYSNSINGNVVSTTAAPSKITFNGQWIMNNIKSASMTGSTITENKWIAGEFAWDGIDSNFLIVGLITCLGAFVALGIYARKSRSGGIIPLMIVTGCAALVFFIMI